jgi:Skp family chaperone for outer membrane proteins
MRGFSGFLIFLGLLVSTAGSMAKAQAGVAVVNMERVFEGCDRAKEQAARSAADSKAADEELESRQTVLRKQVAEIERIKSDAASTSPEKKKELEARIGSARKLDQEIADFRNTRRKDLEDRALKARQAILAEIREVVDRVAKARGCDIVIDSSVSVPGGLPVVVSASAGSDLSSEVLEMLNRAPSSGSGKAGGRTAP